MNTADVDEVLNEVLPGLAHDWKCGDDLIQCSVGIKQWDLKITFSMDWVSVNISDEKGAFRCCAITGSKLALAGDIGACVEWAQGIDEKARLNEDRTLLRQGLLRLRDFVQTTEGGNFRGHHIGHANYVLTRTA